MTTAISVKNLSKRYRIGAAQAKFRYGMLRDVFVDSLMAPIRYAKSLTTRSNNSQRTNEKNFIWALKDISFDLEEGRVLGIVGRNGAGKSTLLKVLSRVTEPTEGTVSVRGRVGSLLEVGTGFHPELTGRENIYMNGAILGMKRLEIDKKFDEMVEFSEVAQFIDTPVKRYSSGMYLRLAFAVAAHLEPEILIIDEVLAVGDAAFQKKCLGKMNEVAKHGRTILFVSHDLTAVNALCNRTLLLHEGAMVMDGPTAEVTAHYLDKANQLYSAITWADFDYSKTAEVNLRSASISQRGNETRAIDCRAPFTLSFEYESRVALPNARFFILIRNARGDVVFGTSDYDAPPKEISERRAGRFISQVTVPAELLKAGVYYGTVGADIKNERVIFAADDVFDFEVFESGDDTLAERHKRAGLIAPVLPWRTTEVNLHGD
jgi:lipopolysaccharide transport system ATP-binding protein